MDIWLRDYKHFHQCRIAKALSNCNSTTGDIISTTERLKQELENTTQRQEIASCFLRDYQLSNDEVLTEIVLVLALSLKSILLMLNYKIEFRWLLFNSLDKCTARGGPE